MLELSCLCARPAAFGSFTGLRVEEFESLVEDIVPHYGPHYRASLERPGRARAVGGGRNVEMAVPKQILLTLVWLRLYPTQEVLGFLFGVSPTTVLRTVRRILPLLEVAGRDTMRPPQAGSRRWGRSLEEILHQVPELAVIIDSFEQPVQRPKQDKQQEPKPRKRRADAYYSGKKKQHTLKSQVAVDRADGTFVDVSYSVPGPTADLTLLQSSGLLQRLPPGVGAWGDLAYLGLQALHPQGLGATPRRKPRGKERPPQDQAYNQAFARERVRVEHSIGRLRRYQALKQADRHHRQNHTARVVAVAGLVNRQIRHRIPCAN